MRVVRNILALGATLFLTFMVFRGVAAFNDVLKMFNALPVETRIVCPEGLMRIKSGKTGQQECIPAPSATKGVVPVGIYIRDRAAPAAPPAASPATPSPQKP